MPEISFYIGALAVDIMMLWCIIHDSSCDGDGFRLSGEKETQTFKTTTRRKERFFRFLFFFFSPFIQLQRP